MQCPLRLHHFENPIFPNEQTTFFFNIGTQTHTQIHNTHKQLHNLRITTSSQPQRYDITQTHTFTTSASQAHKPQHPYHKLTVTTIISSQAATSTTHLLQSQALHHKLASHNLRIPNSQVTTFASQTRKLQPLHHKVASHNFRITNSQTTTSASHVHR